MGLKFKIKALTDVEEAVRGLYRKEGDAYVLDVDGAVDKERLDEFRNNNIELQKQIDKVKDIDPAKYRELVELQNKLKEKQLIEAGKVDEVVNLRVAQMKESLEGQVNELTGKLTSANKTLEMLLLDNVVRQHAAKSGVMATAIDDVVLRAKTQFVMEDNRPVPKTPDGKVVYGKDGTTPMAVEDWVVGLKKSAPHLFAGSQGSGAGGGTGQGHVDLSKMSPADKISYGLSQGAGASLQSGLPKG
jgi:hypothetical protein